MGAAQGDRIDLSGLDANTALAGDQAFSLGAMGTAGNLLVTTVTPGASYLVQVDVNGGGADFAILVNTTTILGTGDFVL